MSARARLIADFLAGAGWAGARRRVLAADASFRRYERVARGGEQAVLMDAPPPRENVHAFHTVAQALLDLGFSAPRPLALDRANGLMLLEDLGDRTFTRALAEGADERALYLLATDVLVALHRRWRPEDSPLTHLPRFDEARLGDELEVLLDWAWPALCGAPAPKAVRASWATAWGAVLGRAHGVPDTLVLRDYHVDNLMELETRQGVAACGLLDFQDALIGPVSYDVVSLLEDARRDVSPDVVADMRARYLDAFPDLDRAAFDDSYTVLGAQRAARIIGVFTRLSRRDGKHQYLRHIPRLWRLLEAGLARPVLAPVKSWFDREIPAKKRLAPRPEAAP